jgi:hypothetical protein
MFGAIRSSHRPTTLITCVTAALPGLPHPQKASQPPGHHRVRESGRWTGAASWSASAAAAATANPRPTREWIEPMAVDSLLNNDPLIGPRLTPAGAGRFGARASRGRAYTRAVGRTSTHSIFQEKEQ